MASLHKKQPCRPGCPGAVNPRVAMSFLDLKLLEYQSLNFMCQATASNCSHRMPRDTNANFLHRKGHISDFATRPMWRLLMAYLYIILLVFHSINCCRSIFQRKREREIRSDQPLCNQSTSGLNNSPEPLSVLRAAAGKALSSTPILRDGPKILNGARWSGI